MAGIVDKIPGMKIRDTVELWRNAIRILENPKQRSKHVEAKLVIKVIEAEWERRRRHPNPDEMFSWPSTKADIGSGNLDTEGWQQEGVLKFMGYKVGNTDGELPNIRERILSHVFTGPLPPIFPKRYLDEWGNPSTARRLQKMAEAIASFTRSAKRRHDARMQAAIKDGEKDLEYLYYEYYVSKFHFAWPESAL